MLRQSFLRINVKRRAEFFGERFNGDAFAKQLVSDVTKIVHESLILGFNRQSSSLANEKPAGENPAGANQTKISRPGQNRRALLLVFLRRNLVDHVFRKQGLQLRLLAARKSGSGGATIGCKAQRLSRIIRIGRRRCDNGRNCRRGGLHGRRCHGLHDGLLLRGGFCGGFLGLQISIGRLVGWRHHRSGRQCGIGRLVLLHVQFAHLFINAARAAAWAGVSPMPAGTTGASAGVGAGAGLISTGGGVAVMAFVGWVGSALIRSSFPSTPHAPQPGPECRSRLPEPPALPPELEPTQVSFHGRQSRCRRGVFAAAWLRRNRSRRGHDSAGAII